jgi:glutathione synthase/RimK-type ligase-like ATP-grasp enzyme
VAAAHAKADAAGVAEKLSTAELLFRAAVQMGLRPSWVSPDKLLAVHYNGGEHYVNFAHSPLNSHLSASLAKDKYLTRLILERNGLPNIPFMQPKNLAEAQGFLQTYKKIIAKPVRGAGANDIHIVTRPKDFDGLEIGQYILEQYIAGAEMRYLILQGKVIGVHESQYGTSVDEHRALKRISYPESEWNPVLAALSLHISRVLRLNFSAVDFLIDANGQPHILEVNTTPGMKWFHAPSSGPVVDLARYFLESMVEGHGRHKHAPLKPSFGPAPKHPAIAYS